MSERIELTKSDLIQQEKAMEEVRKLLLDRYPNRQPLAFTHSYGCQQNISDGEKIRGMLAEMGYGFTNQESELIASSLIPVQSERTRNFVFMAM